MEVGVTHAASLGLEQNLARARRRNLPLLLHQRLAEMLDSGDMHFTGHWITPLLVVAAIEIVRGPRGDDCRAAPAVITSKQRAKRSREGLDDRVDLDLDRLVIGRDRRDLPIDA